MAPVTQTSGIAISALTALTKKHALEVRNQYRTLQNCAMLASDINRQHQKRFMSSNPAESPATSSQCLTPTVISSNASASSQFRVPSLPMWNSPSGRRRWFSTPRTSLTYGQKIMSRMFSSAQNSLFQQSCSTGRPLPQVCYFFIV